MAERKRLGVLWWWVGICLSLGLCGAVLVAACSQEQRDRMARTMFDGVPEDGSDTEAVVVADASPRPLAPMKSLSMRTRYAQLVSSNHTDFADSCQDCHTDGYLVTPDACMECHDPDDHDHMLAMAYEDDEIGRCNGCHQEHRGPDANIRINVVPACFDCHDEEDELASFAMIGHP